MVASEEGLISSDGAFLSRALPLPLPMSMSEHVRIRLAPNGDASFLDSAAGPLLPQGLAAGSQLSVAAIPMDGYSSKGSAGAALGYVRSDTCPTLQAAGPPSAQWHSRARLGSAAREYVRSDSCPLEVPCGRAGLTEAGAKGVPEADGGSEFEKSLSCPPQREERHAAGAPGYHKQAAVTAGAFRVPEHVKQPVLSRFGSAKERREVLPVEGFEERHGSQGHGHEGIEGGIESSTKEDSTLDQTVRRYATLALMQDEAGQAGERDAALRMDSSSLRERPNPQREERHSALAQGSRRSSFHFGDTRPMSPLGFSGVAAQHRRSCSESRVRLDSEEKQGASPCTALGAYPKKRSPLCPVAQAVRGASPLPGADQGSGSPQLPMAGLGEKVKCPGGGEWRQRSRDGDREEAISLSVGAMSRPSSPGLHDVRQQLPGGVCSTPTSPLRERRRQESPLERRQRRAAAARRSSESSLEHSWARMNCLLVPEGGVGGAAAGHASPGRCSPLRPVVADARGPLLRSVKSTPLGDHACTVQVQPTKQMNGEVFPKSASEAAKEVQQKKKSEGVAVSNSSPRKVQFRDLVEVRSFDTGA